MSGRRDLALMASVPQRWRGGPAPDAPIAPSPVLRRSHDPYRALRPRMCTAFCALSPHPGRHLMTSRRPARDLHATDDRRCIQRTGARCVALRSDHDALSCGPLALRWSPSLGWGCSSRRTHPHRIGSVMVAQHPCDATIPDNIRSACAVCRGFLLLGLSNACRSCRGSVPPRQASNKP